MHRVIPLVVVLAWMASPTAGPLAQDVARDPAAGGRATLRGDWLLFETGADETAQAVQVRVWGSLRDPAFFSHGFKQLDQDAPLEYVIISRNAGSGPYYKLQIIDPQPQGILTWSYDSYERPTFAAQGVELGVPPRNGGPATRAIFHLTPRGLEPAGCP